MYRHNIRTVVCCCILLLTGGWLLLSCSPPEPTPEPILIGLIVYDSPGLVQQMGIPTRNAAQLAVDDINARRGVRLGSARHPLELIIKAISSSPQEAVAATRELTNRERVVAIVGPHNSSDAIPAGAFAEKARVPLISPMSTNRRTTLDRDYVFRISFIDELQGAVMARFARTELKAETAAVLHDTTDPYSREAGQIFQETFRKLGGTISRDEHFLPTDTDFRPQLQRIRQAGADVLLLPNFADKVEVQVRQAKQLGLDSRILGCDGWDADRLTQIPEFENSFMSTHWAHDRDDERSIAFTDSYRQRFTASPEAPAALTYDAVMLLVAALEKAGSTDSEQLRSAIYALGPLDGVTGPIDFIDSGDPRKPVVILKLGAAGHQFFRQVEP